MMLYDIVNVTSLGARMAVLAFCFLALLTTSTYTANLAAFVTIKSLATSINSVDVSAVMHGSQDGCASGLSVQALPGSGRGVPVAAGGVPLRLIVLCWCCLLCPGPARQGGGHISHL